MKRVLLLIAALSIVAPLSAQYNRREAKPLVENTHEFRLGIYGLSPYLSFEDMDYRYDPAESFENSKMLEGDTRYVNTLALTYTHRTSHVMEFGAQLSYAAKFTPFYSTYTGTKSHTDSEQYITLMPYARATWLNTSWVRLYSSVSIGLTWEYDKGNSNPFNDVYGAVQFTPVGISVGRQLFGFGELLTMGTNGFATIGIGYRF